MLKMREVIEISVDEANPSPEKELPTSISRVGNRKV